MGLTNCLFCFLLLLTYSAQVHSQIILSGHVTDTTNTPIPLVNVFLTKGEDTSITNYTYTDDTGYYRLEVTHAGEYIFNVNGLSYSNYSSRI
ncbi:MAG: carboxypeptidase-like regulatory domain-containing protein, partial [Maribacter sp.]|nr:carboxypeptidase-like regulatory domain-containing protein [Maribacter sp.]